jgi:hypothetical protein
MARVGDAFMEYGGLGACRRSLWVQRTPFKNNREALFRRRSWSFGGGQCVEEGELCRSKFSDAGDLPLRLVNC